MKKILFILSFFSLFLFLIVFSLKTLYKPVYILFEKFLSQKLNSDIKMEKISFSLPPKVVIKNLAIIEKTTHKPTLFCRFASIYIQPLEYFRTKRVDKIIKKIILNSPFIFIDHISLTPKKGDFDFELQFRDAGLISKKFKFKKISGYIQKTEKNLNIYVYKDPFSAKIYTQIDKEDIIANFQVYSTDKSSVVFNSTGTISGSISQLELNFFSSANLTYQNNNLNFHLEGFTNKVDESFHSVSSIKVNGDLEKTPVNGEGNFSLKNEEFYLDKFNLNIKDNVLSCKGELKDKKFIGEILLNKTKIFNIKICKEFLSLFSKDKIMNIKVLKTHDGFSGSIDGSILNSLLCGEFFISLEPIKSHIFKLNLEKVNEKASLNLSILRKNFSCVIKLDNFKLLDLPTNLTLTSNGNINEDGEITSAFTISNLKINKTTIEPITGNAVYKNNTLKMFNLYSKKNSAEISLNLDKKTILGNISIKRLLYGKKNVAKGEVNFLLADKKLSIKNFFLKDLTQDMEIRLINNPLFDFNKNQFQMILELKNISSFGFNIDGKLHMAGKWGYTRPKMIVLNFETFFDNVWINQFNVNNYKMQFLYKNDLLTFNSLDKKICGKIDRDCNFDFVMEDENFKKIKFYGKVKKKELTANLSTKNINAKNFISLSNLKLPLSGNTNITSTFKIRPKEVLYGGSFEVSNGEFYDMNFESLNFGFNYYNGTLKISNFNIIKKDKIKIEGTAVLPLKEKKIPLNTSINIHSLNFEILKDLWEEIEQANGNLNGEIKIAGELSNPVANGFLKIKNGNITFSKYISGIKDINGDIEIKNNFLVIKSLNGKTFEDSRIEVVGNAEFQNLKLKNCSFQFKVPSKGFKINIPELSYRRGPLLATKPSSGEALPSFSIFMEDNILKMKGDAEFFNTRFTYPPKKGSPPTALSFMKSLHFEIQLRMGKNVWYESSGVSLNVGGDIKITNDGKKIVVNGILESRKGSVNYLGRLFDVKYAAFEIKENQCFLELLAETKVRTQRGEDTIQMIVERAPYRKIKPNFISLTKKDLPREQIDKDIFGIKEDLSLQERDLLLREQFVKMIDETLTSSLAKSLLQEIGVVDSIKITYTDEKKQRMDPDQFSLYDLFEGTKYTFEKYITDDLLIGYAITLAQLQRKLELKHQIELAYKLKGDLFLKGSYEIVGKDALEKPDRRIILEHIWRFHW